MKTTDFTKKTNEQMNAMERQMEEQIVTLVSTYQTKIDAHLKTILKDWQVIRMNDSYIEIGFYTNKQNKEYQSVDLYFGFKYGEKEFQFCINPCCFGSFAIDKPSKQVTYYIGISKLLSDVEFAKQLKNMLIEFHNAKEQLFDELFEVRREICRRKDEEVKKFKAEELQRKLKETKVNITKYDYVLIEKDVESISADLSYRNHPCLSLHFGTEIEMHELLNTEYRKSVVRNRLKVVPVSKVRIANI